MARAKQPFMRSIPATVMLVLTLSIAAVSQGSDLKADANPAVEAEIKALELKLTELIVSAGWDEYAKHLASDYLRTRENGQVENKDETMASLRDVKRNVIVMEMEPSTLAIRIYGDAAISSAEFTIRVRESGQVKSRRTRHTGAFVKRDGEWRLVAEQATLIGK
jgi:ketosteroid isomerase-like protein